MIKSPQIHTNYNNAHLKRNKDMKSKVEDVDGCPGDEEDEADQDQCQVCLLGPGNLPCFAKGCVGSGGMRGGQGEAYSGVEKSDNDTWEEELYKNADKSVGEVVVVRLPFLPSIHQQLYKLSITNLKTKGHLSSYQKIVLHFQLCQNKDGRRHEDGEDEDEQGQEEGLMEDKILKLNTFINFLPI